MEIITSGLFRFDPNKSYVLINSKRVEQGVLEVVDDKINVVFNDERETLNFDNSTEFENWLKDNNFIITSDSIRWVTYNPNPKNNKANDCSIRAYCAAENLKWEEAYDIACQYGKDNSIMPNDAKNCKNILEEEFGYSYHKLKKEQKGITVKEFAINHPEGIFVLNLPGHLVSVIDGEYYDSWDSGKKKITGYYSKK